MKYLVIWFVLVSTYGYSGPHNNESMINKTYNSPVEEKVEENTTKIIYKNYVITDSLEKAKRIAGEKQFRNDCKVYIYELGRQYKVEQVPYEDTEVVKVTKYNTIIKEEK